VALAEPLKLLGSYAASAFALSSVTQPKLSALVQSEQFNLHKEQTCRFPDWASRGLIFGSPTWRASDAGHLSQLPIISRTKTRQGPAIY